MATHANILVDVESVRAYAGRDWELVDASRRAYWAERFRRHGPEATLSAGWALLSQLRALRPGRADERDEDLAHHFKLNRWLDRTAHVQPGR